MCETIGLITAGEGLSDSPHAALSSGSPSRWTLIARAGRRRLEEKGQEPLSRVGNPRRQHGVHGMAHGLRLRGGRAEWYRSRFVLSAQAAEALGRAPIPGPAPAVATARSIPTSPPRPASSTRWSRPATCRSSSTRAWIASPAPTSAARWRPASRRIPGTTPRRGCSTRSSTSRACRCGISPSMRRAAPPPSRRIDLPQTPMIHDVAFTASSIVVLDLPVTYQPETARTGRPWLWDERKAARVGLVPRDGDVGRLRFFEAPRCFVFHLLNA